MIKLIVSCDCCGKEISRQEIPDTYTVCFSLTELRNSDCFMTFDNGKFTILCRECLQKKREVLK